MNTQRLKIALCQLAREQQRAEQLSQKSQDQRTYAAWQIANGALDTLTRMLKDEEPTLTETLQKLLETVQNELCKSSEEEPVIYTVDLDTPGFPVLFRPDSENGICQWIGPFADPGEASQEFKAQMGSGIETIYLEPASFALLAGQSQSEEEPVEDSPSLSEQRGEQAWLIWARENS